MDAACLPVGTAESKAGEKAETEIVMNNELTQKDIERMEEEIEYRKLVVRKQALEDVKSARAHGDLSENFEYHAAKKVKNQKDDQDGCNRVRRVRGGRGRSEQHR